MTLIRATIAVLFLLLLSGQLLAKEAPLTEEESTVVQVYEVPGYTKDQMFAAAKIWVAENFKSAKAVIEYDNKDDGVIVGNGSMNYPCSGGFDCLTKSDWRVPFTMKIECKDGRFRLTFSRVHLSWPPSYSGGVSMPAYDGAVTKRKDMDKIRPKLLELGNSLAASMSKVKSSDNW